MTSSAGQRRLEKLDPSRGYKLNPPSPTSKNTASSNMCQSDSTVLEELRNSEKTIKTVITTLNWPSAVWNNLFWT